MPEPKKILDISTEIVIRGNSEYVLVPKEEFINVLKFIRGLEKKLQEVFGNAVKKQT